LPNQTKTIESDSVNTKNPSQTSKNTNIHPPSKPTAKMPSQNIPIVENLQKTLTTPKTQSAKGNRRDRGKC